ncbi:seipin-like protein [Leptotrombidium deliense]|uniref:Seipin n=1 Tax=Leptotrombidium deliense TaxID=299467 RepID=A0A443SVR8_9ACAR|nr:seipin-like protein [Leptotrombidium deliense]
MTETVDEFDMSADSMNHLKTSSGTDKRGFFSSMFSFPRFVILLMWRSLRRLTFVTILVVTIVWSSTFIYITLYYLYVPDVLHKKVINFQFDSECLEKCLHPYAEVPLSDHKTPTIFSRGQQYIFTVNLHLPESDVNWEQGMFMVKISLYDVNQKLIKSISRSTILHYKSPLVRIISVLAYWPLLITGFRHEEQFLTVPITENYIDGIYPGLGNAVFARVFLEARHVQVYSSTLIIEANLSGLRYFMVNWSITCAILGIFSIMCFLSMVTVLSVYRIVSSVDDEENEETNNFENSGLFGEVDETTTAPDSTVDNKSEIDFNEGISFVRSDECGAIHTFLGTTRNTEKSKEDNSVCRIKHLFYECYMKMAISEMENIVRQEMEKLSEVHKCYIKHRLGCVAVGQTSIMIAASSVHRQAAQSVVVSLLDRIKKTVPIWKKISFENENKQTWSDKSEAFWLQK